MSLSMYTLTIPTMLRGFGVLGTYVERAAGHARATNLDPSVFLQARLAPDMLPFIGQIQRASDKSKNGISRLTGVEAPSFPDTELTFDDLQARIAESVQFLQSLNEKSFEGSDSKTIEIKFRSINGIFTGEQYLMNVLLPDFFFHVATAHDILRNQGLPLGKADYLGRLN